MFIAQQGTPAPWAIKQFQIIVDVPAGYKRCADTSSGWRCPRVIPAKDKHARCQRCRAGGGYGGAA